MDRATQRNYNLIKNNISICLMRVYNTTRLRDLWSFLMRIGCQVKSVQGTRGYKRSCSYCCNGLSYHERFEFGSPFTRNAPASMKLAGSAFRRHKLGHAVSPEAAQRGAAGVGLEGESQLMPGVISKGSLRRQRVRGFSLSGKLQHKVILTAVYHAL